MVASGDASYLILHGRPWLWSPAGYRHVRARVENARLLTPPSTVRALGSYRPDPAGFVRRGDGILPFHGFQSEPRLREMLRLRLLRFPGSGLLRAATRGNISLEVDLPRQGSLRRTMTCLTR